LAFVQYESPDLKGGENMRKILIIAVLLISASCQESGVGSKEVPTEKEGTASQFKNKPVLTLQLNGENLRSETVWECWVESCTKESAFTSKVHIEGGTETSRRKRTYCSETWGANIF
jgi:hypothetical protein